MVAVRWPQEPDDAPRDGQPQQTHTDPDWLTLQEAACELRISVGTARRLLRQGKLRNRIVPRPGGFAYRVYMPGSRHAAAIRTQAEIPATNGQAPPAGGAAEVRRLERQVEQLSEALSRALRLKQTALPPGIGGASANPADPYERYRWLTRRRRWWPF